MSDNSINASPVEDNHSTDLDNKEDIIYNARPVATNSIDEKTKPTSGDADSVDSETAGLTADTHALDTALKLVTRTLDITDDPTQSPFTFRSFILGLGLSTFGAVLAEIFYFKPQTVNVNSIFLIIIAYCLGEATTLIPRAGAIGRFLNPGPFSQKEHVFIVIMANSAAVCALGTEQLAAQALYYDEEPNGASAIFMLLSSQCIGYGLLGMMRKMFVYPTKFVWPLTLPLASLFQSMHLDKTLAKKRLKIFWIICVCIMVWELIPEYIMPWTVGISIFCLANQNSALFTYLFGGANGDEGLGFLGWCMDWQYITTDCLVLPMNTLLNQLFGYFICVALTIGAYYGNVWRAKDFPFMAQDLFKLYDNGTTTVYDQTQILDSDNVVDDAKLEAYGLPWFATSNAMSMLVMNMAITAAVVHVFLWNWNDLKFMFTWMTPSGVKEKFNSVNWKFWTKSERVEVFPGTEGDPHFAAMQAYKETPAWWYHAILFISIIIGLICCYQQRTQLPWWAFLIAVAISWFLSLVYACIYGITGFYYQPVTAIQMIGAYMVPKKPVANMMFTLYGSNSLVQALLMLSDLKLAYIVKSQRDVLLSVEGTSLWSGQNVQSYNAQAIAWGGAADKIFGRDGEYWQVPMGLFYGIFVPIPFYVIHKLWPKLRADYVNTFIILNWLGWLSVGINTSLLPYFMFGIFTQGYLRKYKAVLFAKWHLTTVAAIAGGTSIIVFILTFAVSGGAGVSRPFPEWWGNSLSGNVDHCKYTNGE
ncbi:Oligopeptide transporter 5 [Cytospora mali]|uniref:Oligopeptide transporter 5 n=1 Tax=Cytospora mali TaxID=578113 RepID=A0A194V1N4_CYTMA|nr:Oligopeptide transporter 5 [Valsa mali var. pyri (nom. inval.)]